MKLRDYFTNWLHWDKKDVFTKTRLRLTFYYSFILTLFLVVFVAIVLFILFRVIISDEERKINELANQEVRQLTKGPQAQRFRQENRNVFLSENQLFYYVTNPEGELLISNEAISPLRPMFLELIETWDVTGNEIKQETINVPADKEENSRLRDLDLRVLMLGRPIMANGETVGMMYIGLDITYFNTIFKWVLIVFLGLAVLFIGVAIWLSNLMSKKALVPVETAYNQQREFVANASHELRTPLSVIFSSLEALEMEKREEDAFTTKIQKGMKSEVKRMTKLINDLLTLAHLDSDQEKQSLNREWFDFAEVSDQASLSFRNLASEKKVYLHFQAADPSLVYGDKDKLTQLLYILVDNAIKYTNNGGEVTVDIHTGEKQLTIKVFDTGVGITEEDKLRIFDRFYRVDKARTRKEGGYGLGLSIAEWIVTAHGGTIKVESETGIGSVFEVNIPY
ncbi:sensor histidine kinase [Sediminibacillus massiliensis]|uniref:sensor histidine kinase n=1 Tax=Sediminibacillus massiliensis TaxID=1926277 RepID=UPI001FE3FC44|nr:ATP-binding protein [Sediminibacillus massiliensis]